MPEPVTAEQDRKDREAEYAEYVAAVEIDINGARAFNVGHAVPIGHVTSGVVDASQVKKITTKAGQAIVAGTSEKG